MSILVTGASGFIGLNLIEKLSTMDYEIKATSRNIPNINLNNVKWYKIDVTKRDEIINLIDKDTEIIFHLAGVAGVEKYISNPVEVIDVNFESTRYIIEASKKSGSKIIYASSAEVYGKNKKVPLNEDDDRILGSTKKQRWIYSTSKALSEHLLFAEMNSKSVDAIIVRLFHPYGKYQKPFWVVPKMIISALQYNKVTVYDEGKQIRCFTYISDIIDALTKLMESRVKNEYFNISSDRKTSISELANIIANSVNNNNIIIEHIDTKDKFGGSYEDLAGLIPDISKIKSAIKWQASTSLENGIAQTVEWYKNNKEWWQDLVKYI